MLTLKQSLVCQMGTLHNNGVYVLYKLLHISLMIGDRVCLMKI